MKRILLSFALLTLAAISIACSPAAAAPIPSGPVADGPTIIAKDLKFDRTSVEVKADQNFTLHFDNQESAPHNVAIYADSGFTQKVSIGEIVTSARKDQVVPALKAGTYFFRCDIHPAMKGEIVAR
ncbi:MAG TPA: cupredoxin domain-containing protein [Candidatus Limnocylindrales bacterium]|nr:cupredoxin domain-containing protein [Candidatus Limnocylindrales bacterium]